MDSKVGLALGFTGHHNVNTSSFSLNKGAYFRKMPIVGYNMRFTLQFIPLCS
jgi:hypothetical protein